MLQAGIESASTARDPAGARDACGCTRDDPYACYRDSRSMRPMAEIGGRRCYCGCHAPVATDARGEISVLH